MITYTNPATQISNISIDALKPHPRNEGIYGVESVEELASKIAETEWIKPLVVSTRDLGFTILSGHRRFLAAKSLGISELPCELKECESEIEELEILLLENQYREKSTYQKVKEGEVWHEIERVKSKSRQGTRTDIVPNLAPSNSGKTRDKVAEKIGMNRSSYETAKKVATAIDELKETGRHEDAEVLTRVMDKSISGALKAAKSGVLDKVETEVKQGLLSGDLAISDVCKQVAREEKEKEREAARQENLRLIEATPRAKVITGKFSTILLDPPWDWGDEGDHDQMGRAKPTYGTMSIEELLKLPVEDFADDNCHMYLWITNRSLPKGFQLLEKWGFRYITAITWVKPSFGMGNYFRGQTEHMLFGVKGSLQLKRKNAPTFFEAERGKRHSEKPEYSYEFIESCSPGPYLEMFSRNNRENWYNWGAEV